MKVDFKKILTESLEVRKKIAETFTGLSEEDSEVMQIILSEEVPTLSDWQGKVSINAILRVMELMNEMDAEKMGPQIDHIEQDQELDLMIKLARKYE